MKPLSFFLLLIAVALLPSSSAGEAPVLGSRASDLAAAVKQILPGACTVIHVEPDEVYLDVNREKGALKGQRYVIERTGEEILHPVSGEVMGRKTVRIAEIQLTWVEAGMSKAKIVKKEEGAVIQVKDSARTVDPPVVWLLPVTTRTGNRSRLCEVVEAEIAAALSDLGHASLFRAAVPPGPGDMAAVIVSGDISETKLTINVRRAGKKEAAAGIEVPLDEAARSLLGQPLGGAAPVAAKPVTSPFAAVDEKAAATVSIPLSFIPVDMAVADLDGDGANEIVFAEEKQIRIGRVGADGKFEEIGKAALGWNAQAMHVTAGDVDRDGRAEIYLTEKPGNYVVVAGFTWQNGALKKVMKDGNTFVRVIDSGEGDVLYGQKFGYNKPFDKGVFKASIDKGGLKPQPAGIPPTITLHDFVPLGSSGFIASMDYENKLALYNNLGEKTWRSGENFGGSDIRIESADKRNSIEERSGIALIDLDGDQVDEVIAVQNILEGGLGPGFVRLGILQSYKTGRIVALNFADGQLIERWKTKTFSGMIKGFSAPRRGSRRQLFFFTLEKISLTKKRATLHIISL